MPWSIFGLNSDVQPEKITSDLSFYEINSCEFSLAEVLIKNPKIAYQKHFRISPNNYSTIQCFGKITGLDRIGNTFYISVGTNSLLSLIIKSLPLLIIISFIGKTLNQTYLRKIYGDENYSAIQLTTASGVCSVLKMYLDGKISNKGFVKQESLSWNDFIENKFGQVYA